ncbi:hypothetical protein HHI36_015038 [Cryptolaemus montrouzieri]|uniref:Ionotropic glutamate receptor C-terminal domain-containing protein n=1 Tax=Cryptolaemus montrouzieri TaxID=559131 RepID=A0ABD2N4F0_9CUCU
MLPVFQKYLIFKIVFVAHEVATDSLRIFVLRARLRGPGFCLQKNQLLDMGLCQTNDSLNRLRAFFRIRFPTKFKNCSIQGIAMRYEPFVISKNKGFEIEILKNMAEYLNTTFDLEISMKSEDWGDKVNGTWQDNFGKIFNTLKIGIGNVAIEADRIDDFDFTFSHYTTTLIWVVPIADYVEKWRVLTIIFSLDIWAISFSVISTVAILFILAARISGDIRYLKSISGAFLSSFQIIINSSVHKTPTTDSVRLIFVIALIFALLITCIYTSGLMHVLRSAVREHQIHTVDEILESDLEIGGLMEYRERFKNPENDDCIDEICKRYKYFTGENDTAQTWLSMVDKRLACTPLPRPFVKYYMIRTYEKVDKNASTDDSGKIKLFIMDDPINFYPIAVVMRKGNPFRKIFDGFLKRFSETGLLLPILIREYRQQYLKVIYLAEHSDDGPEQLNVYHLQGLFAILVIGYFIAIVAFVIEITIGRRHEKNKRRFESRKNNPKNKKFYYDKRFGDMYGKTYPRNPHAILPL